MAAAARPTLRVPDQVVRIAVLLAAGLTGLLVLRARFVPDSFGEIGHYRAAALPAIAAQPLRYAGTQACAECHTDEAQAKARSYHRGLACEGCHGAANDHAQDPEKARPQIPRDRGACVRCHAYHPGRPTGFPQIIETAHNPMKPCPSCHNPHDPTPPRVPGACEACHGTIARTKAVSHHASLQCETCHETPREHRTSPRANPPSKPREREFCGRCHAPDAKSPPEIPRIDLATHGGRYLCWQCHYPHYPEAGG